MAVVTSNAPGTPGVMNATLLATTAYNNALARSKQNTMTSLRNYGYEADINPEGGALSNLRVSAQNPSGQYQQMLRSHAQQDETARGDAVGRGLSGGLANQLRSNARYGYGNDAAALGIGVQGAVSGYADELQTAGYERDATLWQAQQQAARDAIGSGSYNAPDYSGLPYPDYGGGSDPGYDPYAQSEPLPADPGASNVPGISNATRNKLIKQMYSKGIVLSAWAKAHPEAAQQLGVGTAYGSNNKLLKEIYAGKPPKVIQTAKPKPKPKPKPKGGK